MPCGWIHARRLVIHGQPGSVDPSFVAALKQALQPFTQGQCDVCIEYLRADASALVTLGDHWMVRPTRELRDRLNQMLGEDSVTIHYPRH